MAPLEIAKIRKAVSEIRGIPILARLNDNLEAVAFSLLKNIKSISNRGPLTPDHIIRTKRTPVVISSNFEKDLAAYSEAYNLYFEKHKEPGQVKLDAAPRWAVLPDHGTMVFDVSTKGIQIIEDITQHTRKAIYEAEQLGGWRALPKSDLFEMEYWSLEQAKLKKAGSAKTMQGKVAIITGAADGIGKACVEAFVESGGAVTALDINPVITSCFNSDQVLGVQCDVTHQKKLKKAVEQTVRHFGGIDMIISNVGIFPPSKTIAEMDREMWQKSLDINVTSHQQLIQMCIPYLELGFDPAIVIIGSKNVTAPGPGAAAYSVAKAGLAQLARIAAMELGTKGIRVNTIHPNAVFDTGLWTEEILAARAKHYGLTVAEYKTNNILKKEITSKDVADLAITMLGPTFSKITGAQVPIDGGNDRVI